MDGEKLGLWLLGAGLALGLGCGRADFPWKDNRNTAIGPTDYLFTIGQGQMSSNLATVLPTARVTILNRDTFAHQVVSDRDASGRPVCPEMDGPVIAAGSGFTFIMANHPEVCSFHDLLPNGSPANAPSATIAPTQVAGTIIVNVAPGGSGSTSGGSSGGAFGLQ